MSHPRTFRRGGLVLDTRRGWALPATIPNAFLPSQALVLLRQHDGAASRPVVSVGDFVREGALIGKGEGPGSANIHAPVPGIVKDLRRVREAAGGPCLAVEILLKGNFDRLGKREERYVWTSMSKSDLIQTLRDKGVVETDEPGRPLVDILAEAGPTQCLILNGIESEPWIRTENAILADRRDEVLDGFGILRRLFEPARSILAAEIAGEDEGAGGLLSTEGIDPSIEVLRFHNRYPQDLRNQLLEALPMTRPRTQEGRVVIVRPSTALAVHEAIVHSKPVIERYVTIAGSSIKHPAILKARIGTLIGDLVEECGGFVGRPEKIILGGPLRGRPVHDLDVPLTKQTSAVLALAADETRGGRRMACIRCSRCADVCPERLLPSEIHRRIEAGRLEEAETLGLSACTLCGACGYICPSRLGLVETMATARPRKETHR